MNSGLDKGGTQKFFHRPNQGVSNFSQILTIQKNEPKPQSNQNEKGTVRFEKIKANRRKQSIEDEIRKKKLME